MAQPRDLSGSRRELALVLGEDEMTANEVAKAMGKPTGSIFGVLRRMHTEELLLADSDPDPPTRGTQYRLSRRAADLLRESLAADDQAGQLSPGQQIVVVERTADLLPPMKVLANNSLAGVISWTAELPGGWLLVISPEVDSFRVHDLRIALEGAGCRCRDFQVNQLVPGGLLRERATTLTRDRERAR